MTLQTMIRALGALTTVALVATPALAQDIEDGATTRTYDGSASASTSSSSGLRIGLQIRLDALNVLGPIDSTRTSPGATGMGGSAREGIGRRLLVPLAAVGVRLVDQRLFLGAGFGFHGWSTEDDPGNEASQSGIGLSPLVQFDVLREAGAALSLGGAVHFASLGEVEVCPAAGGGCDDVGGDATGVGLSLGAGVRGLITPGLALGGDFGWGFLSLSDENDGSAFVHGIYAAIMLEATIGV
jgi:hypothetical protein